MQLLLAILLLVLGVIGVLFVSHFYPNVLASRPLVRACVAEFIACLVFVFMGSGSVTSTVLASPTGEADTVQYALSFGLTITILAYAIGDISGGHINPAVTLSMVLSNNMTPMHGALYFISQCAGASMGGGLLHTVAGPDYYQSGIGLNLKINAHGGLVCEFMGTFLLIFTVFFVAVEHSKRKVSKEGLDMGSESSFITALAPLPIGFAVLVAHVVIGPLTGCGINPARVLGAVIWSKDPFPHYHWIYWAGPFLASCTAPAVYYFMYGTLHDVPAHANNYEDDSTTYKSGDLEAPLRGDVYSRRPGSLNQ
jgi:MIP family channel proteins